MVARMLALSRIVRYDVVAKRQEADQRDMYPGDSDIRFPFDEKADAIYLCLDDSKVIESEDINPGIVLDFSNHNPFLGIEIFDVRDRVVRADLLRRLRVEGCQ